MKRGRELFTELSALDDEAMVKRVQDLKAADLASLAHYMEGLEVAEPVDRVQGTVLVVAAYRYFAKARKKQIKKTRKFL